MNKQLSLFDPAEYKVPNSAKYRSMMKKLDDHAKINNYSANLRICVNNYLIIRYKRKLELIQWEIMLSKLDSLLGIGDNLLIEEINKSIESSSFVLISDRFYEKYKMYEADSEELTDYIF